jgi:hypothetical protein
LWILHVHAKPSDVEEMIQMRLEEENWSKERRRCGQRILPR